MKQINNIMTISILFCLLSTGNGFSAQVGDASPDFSFQSITGDSIKFKDLKGKNPLFLVFWATWCPRCKEEIPVITELYNKFAPRGMKFIGINVGINDSKAKVKRYISKYKIPYPVVFDNGSIVTTEFGVRGTPTVIIIDNMGTIRYNDSHMPEDLEKHFSQLIKN